MSTWDKYVDLQDIYVNMQHNYVDTQENCNRIKIILILKKIKLWLHVATNMLDASYLCPHATYLCRHTKYRHVWTLVMKVGKGRPTPILDQQKIPKIWKMARTWGGGRCTPNLDIWQTKNKNKIKGEKNQQFDVQILIREGSGIYRIYQFWSLR